MKHNLRAFAALLAVMMSVSPLLASCGETEKNNPGGTDSQTASDSKAEEKDPLMDDLGEYDFKGYEYRVLSAKYDPNGTFVLFDVNEEVGDVLPDSLYKRNREIEERFNIKFVATEDEWWNNRVTLRNVVQADEDVYDMIMMINREAFPAALDNLLMPVSKLTHLDLDKDYYLKDINSALTINGKQILAYSQESVYTFERALVTAFNKKIAEDLQIPDLYETVKSGKWTNDLLFKYAEMATQDIDGNGELDKDDQWGLIGYYGYVYPSFWLGANVKMVEKDENDIPYIAASSDKFDSIIQMIVNKMSAKNVFNTGTDYETFNKLFVNDKALFITTVVGRLFAFREMNTDFGILPSAKYDESQDRYYSGVIDAWLHVVPSNNRDPERTSVIMEALASGSARYVFPAYYEKAMQQKILRDEESIEMMEIVQDTRIIDMAQCPWNDYLFGPITDRVLFGKTLQSVASAVEAVKNEALAAIDEVVEYTNTLE